jgi:tetratricopeptide (TPR) repeat protein
MTQFPERSSPVSSWLEFVASTTHEAPVPDLEPGAQLGTGRYVVQRKLGRGGMGVVYAVRDEERGESVALKTLTRSSPAAIYRIKNEFRALSHLIHPNLVRLYELFEDQGHWCFTLELVEGETLFGALQGASSTALRAALRQLANGICALHAAGKLHRDLKPSNIMLTPSGRVVILDFGLAEHIPAKASDRLGHRNPSSGPPSGTPGYMAPELALGTAATRASDWYAFGVIVSVLTTGRLPNPGAAGSRAHAEPAEALSQQVTHEFAELCRALLSAEPEARPEAAEVLRWLGDATPVFPRDPSRPICGRERELDWLRQGYAESRRGTRPVLLLLSGDCGIGKTALVEAFLAELRETTVFVGRCYEYELLPFKAFDALIDELSLQLARLAPETLSEVLPPEFAALCRLFPVLGRVRAPAAPPDTTDADPHESRRRGFQALGQLLARLRETKPLVLWIDDLQWTDADSTRLLLHLLRQPAAAPILLIASHRGSASQRHPLLRPLYEALSADLRLDLRTLELGPLTPEASAQLLEGASPGAPRTLIEQARGNPFLLEELLRLAPRMHSDGVPRAACSGGSESSDWPSLAVAIETRLAALSDAERRLLELLALAGRPLPPVLVRAAAGAGWQAALQTLTSTRFALRSAVDGSSSCYHDAVREAVLGTLSPRRIRQGHRRLALGLLHAADALPEALAVHLAGAGHPLRAARQMILAAARAGASLAFERAAQLYQSALELGRFTAAEARRLQLCRAHALASAGHGRDAAELYLELVDGADAAAALELRTSAAEQYLLSGRLEPGLGHLGNALRSLGLRWHESALGTIALFWQHRLQLCLRGRRFVARPVSSVTADRLRLLQRASHALARLDPLRASELASRALLLALRAGSAEAISQALVGDMMIGALFRVPAAELLRRRQCAEQACAQFGSAQDHASLHSALAAAARLEAEPDLAAALGHLERFLEVHSGNVLPRASYERPWEEWARAVVLFLQGELGRVARDVPARLDEGWARGDHCIVPLWAGGDALLARFAVGDVAGAEHDWARAERAWSSRSFALQDLMLALGGFYVQRRQGDARATWQVAEVAWRRFSKSPLRRMPNAADTMHSLRGHAALERCARATAARERGEFLELAKRCLRPAPRRPNLAAVFRCHLLAAAYQHQRGDSESAERALERAEAHLRTMPLYFQAVRYRRGLLLGTQRGQDWVAQARAFLRANGAADPDQVFDWLLPGYQRAS